jgi:ribosomal protein RSM22 (predicted rRNA methylase)
MVHHKRRIPARFHVVEVTIADLPADLREALATQLAGQPAERLRASVARLVEAYRSGDVFAAPILASPTDVAAYAAYRMPATFAAVRRTLASLVPWSPASLLDLGGGTGAAAWAAAETFESLTEITVVDRVGGALMLGAALAREASSPAVRTAHWITESVDAPTVITADLVTVTYVLGELTPAVRPAVVARAMASGSAVAIVEPGTPAGYARILDARAQLIAAGATITAPCPHQAACPLVEGDWCHFGARVNRSSLHRRVKDGELSYEDEKFSFVVAVPAGSGLAGPAGSGPPYSRVLRRPVARKGMVSLVVCRPDGTAGTQIISKRHGEAYRRARDLSWGDAFRA